MKRNFFGKAEVSFVFKKWMGSAPVAQLGNPFHRLIPILKSLALALSMFPDYAWTQQQLPASRVIVLDTVPIRYQHAPGIHIRIRPYQSMMMGWASFPALWLVARMPYLVQADLNIRGLPFESSRPQIGNIELYDPQTGHHTLNLPAGRLATHLYWQGNQIALQPRIAQPAMLIEGAWLQYQNRTEYPMIYQEVALSPFHLGWAGIQPLSTFWLSYLPDPSTWLGLRYNRFDATGMYAPTSVLPAAQEQTTVMLMYIQRNTWEGLTRFHHDQFQYTYVSAAKDTYHLENRHWSWLTTWRILQPWTRHFKTYVLFSVDGISNQKVLDATGNPFVYRLLPGGGLTARLHQHWQIQMQIQWSSLSHFWLPQGEVVFRHPLQKSRIPDHKAKALTFLIARLGYAGRFASFNERYYTDPVHRPDNQGVPEQWAYLHMEVLHTQRCQITALARYFTALRDWVWQPDYRQWQAQTLTHIWFAGIEGLIQLLPSVHISGTLYHFFLPDSVLHRLKYVGRTPLIKTSLLTAWGELTYLYQPWIPHQQHVWLINLYLPVHWRQWTCTLGVRDLLQQYQPTPWQKPYRLLFLNLVYRFPESARITPAHISTESRQ